VNENQSPVPDLVWMRLAAEAKPVPEWYGDLKDDCTALWAGFILRAEWMDEDDWWWAVTVEARNLEIASSRDHELAPTSGEEARAAAVRAARAYLYPSGNPR
jgi:hypothetical protein